jgi:hypothetical protein
MPDARKQVCRGRADRKFVCGNTGSKPPRSSPRQQDAWSEKREVLLAGQRGRWVQDPGEILFAQAAPLRPAPALVITDEGFWIKPRFLGRLKIAIVGDPALVYLRLP